jgi:hypothetical protein
MRHRNGPITPRVAAAQIARPLIYCANPLFRRSLISVYRIRRYATFLHLREADQDMKLSGDTPDTERYLGGS